MVINIFGSRSSSGNSAQGDTDPTAAGNTAPKHAPDTPIIPKKQAHIIVIGNEKGGSGKTTTTMHLIVALLRLGFSVGSIDLDARQRTLSRYVENRRQTITKSGTKLPLPHHIVIKKSPFNLLDEAEADERDRFTRAITKLATANDFVVIDSPGNDTFLSRFAHSFADTVVTPINDSFVDLDVLATVDGSTLKVVRPSIYSEMVWEQKLLRAKRDGGSIEWIVMRNRLSNIDARNKRFMTQVLTELSRRIGFRVAPGFSERVIFREMFLQGLTVLDVLDTSTNVNVSMSHVAARQEVRELLKTLRIPVINERVARLRTKATTREEGAKPQQPPQPKQQTTEVGGAVPVQKPAAATATASKEKDTATPVRVEVVADNSKTAGEKTLTTASDGNSGSTAAATSPTRSPLRPSIPRRPFSSTAHKTSLGDRKLEDVSS